ncbi:MAG: phosphoribosylanthranilate isomerase [Marinifilaceae bacterium]
MLIKVCGMRNETNIREVEAIGIEWMGFIFYPLSPRYVDMPPAYMPKQAKRIGVFVNETIENIQKTAQLYQLDGIQLHGDERIQDAIVLRGAGYIIIKAFAIYGPEDFANVTPWTTVCDYVLFDTKCSTYGGSGVRFNWELLNHYTEATPFILSGGITPQCAERIQQLNHPQLAGLDLNSGFETEPGYKNTQHIARFINQLNHNQ